MSTFLTLCRKEWLEAWRDRKLIWLPVVICILAISQPISLYYMPQILEVAGNLPEGAVIELPIPTGEEVLAGTLSQLGMIGTVVFILSVMGSIVQERNSGALSLVMARPVSPLHYIASKWTANAIILLLSFAIGYFLAYYYTTILFNRVEVDRFLGSFAVFSLWILFILAVTLLGGVLFKKAGGVAGVSLILAAFVALCGSLMPKYTSWSSAALQTEATHYLMNGAWTKTFEWMVLSNLALLVVIFILTVMIFKKYESY